MDGNSGVVFDANVMGQMSVGIILLVAVLVLWKRAKAMYRPMNKNSFRIILPLLFLTPAFTLFMDSRIHLTVGEVLIPALIGIVCSIPLMLTTVYEIREDGNIYMKKDMWFIISFLAILSLRFLLRGYLQTLEPINFTSMVIIIGICYLVPWRIVSFIKFRKIVALSART